MFGEQTFAQLRTGLRNTTTDARGSDTWTWPLVVEGAPCSTDNPSEYQHAEGRLTSPQKPPEHEGGRLTSPHNPPEYQHVEGRLIKVKQINATKHNEKRYIYFLRLCFMFTTTLICV